MSVSPTVCTTLANGLGRGRSRSARATPPTESATAKAPQRAKIVFMAPKVTSRAPGTQGSMMSARPARTRLSRVTPRRLRLNAAAGGQKSVHADRDDAVRAAGVVAIQRAVHVRAAGIVGVEA